VYGNIFFLHLVVAIATSESMEEDLEISGRDEQEVRVPAFLHRIRPLGALLECGRFEDSSVVDRKIARGQKE
jgi:hypothetical protein